jgi:predicted extracellular nuclease
MALALVVVASLLIPSNTFLHRLVVRSVLADSTPQTLPLTQQWTNTGMITANDNWSGVPGIEGYLGQDITTGTGTDPQTLLGTSAVAGDLTVLANQTTTTITNGDVAEFHTTSQPGAPGADPTIALQGSGTADAPYVLFYLNTTGQSGVSVAYNLRDIDCTADNAVQPVALQYRVGNSGNFTNVPAGFVADATTGPSLCTQVTAVNAALPAAVDNQPLVQVRVMTTNAVGSDEWVGVDDINISTGVVPNTLNIGDVTQTEGNAGTSTFNFNVSLTQPAGAGGVSFTVNTADGTTNPANAGSDYVAIVGGAGSISAGNSATTVSVTVNGDTTPEPNETFFVNISGVTGANPGDVQGLGTITNDDVTLTAIHDIQGTGSLSPLNGNAITTSGIVTGLKTGSSGGFFIQEPDASVDADPNTSEGIFVFTAGSVPAGVAVGNLVQVSGNVSEFVFASDPSSPPITEISGTLTVNLLTTGNVLPTPVTLTGAETTQASETSNPLDSLEEYEGMRVTVPSLTVCAPTQGTITEPSATVASNGVFYGVVTGVARPFREPGINISDPLPTGAPATVPRFDENPERIRVDSDGQPGTTLVDVSAGTVLTNITGPLDYSFRTYTILPDTTISTGAAGGSVPVPAATANEVTVASFNMERFFDTVNDPGGDPVLTAAAFSKRLTKASLIIRNVQRYPDIIGVEEMENLSTLQAVAAQVNSDAQTIDALPNPNYVAYLVEGNDIGGIDVGFLVKESRLTTVDVTQIEQPGCDHVTASTCFNYTNPNNGSLDILNDRPPLVLRVTVPRPAGGTLPLTVIVNHLRSLNGIDDNTVDGTGTVGARVREKRRKQAEFLANYIQGRQTSDPTELIISVGDMNAFRVNDGFVDSIGTILGTPAPASQVTLASSDLVNPDLTDLVDVVPATQQYSYTFDGNAQTLDHVIVNRKALVFVTRIAYARDDADYAVKNYELTNDLRISDHDQPVAYFSLTLAPTASSSVVSGRITDDHGAPLAGAVVNLSGSQNRKMITDANGDYRFENVETSGFYTVRPSRADYSFSPEERSFSQVGNSTVAGFTGSLSNNHINVIDMPEYFVRQHYLDFLGREPDEAGFNFWSDQILECGADSACAERRTINVSAAYFLSIEFMETGGFVDGLYRATYGHRPLYADFMPDTSNVSRGVIVGTTNWSQQLAANKQAFLNDWITRPEFRTLYDGMNNSQYVDALISHAGGFNGDRDALVNGLNQSTLTRAAALRAVAENDGFNTAKRNGMFVMMEYFGYLRRDPDEDGFNFWLNKLNQHNGNFEQAEMVKSFIVSGEYRNRFAGQ